nr:hypothetical protein [uncultured bacterium]
MTNLGACNDVCEVDAAGNFYSCTAPDGTSYGTEVVTTYVWSDDKDETAE